MQKLSIGGLMATGLFLVVLGRMLSLQQGLPIERAEVDSRSAELFEALQSHGLLPEPAGAHARLFLPAEDTVLAQQAAGSPLPDLPARQKLLNQLYGSLQGQRVRKQVSLWNLGHRMAAVRDDRRQAGDRNAWRVHDSITGRGLSSTAMLAAEFVYVGGDRLRAGFHDWRTSISDNPLSFTTTFVVTEPGTVQIQIIGTLDAARLKADLNPYHPRLQARFAEPDCAHSPAIARELTLRLQKGSNPVTLTVGSVPNNIVALDSVAIYLKPRDEPAETFKSTAQEPSGEPAAAAISSTTCKSAWDATRYTFGWDAKRLRRNSRNLLDTEKVYVLLTRDGVALTEAPEAPSDAEAPPLMTKAAARMRIGKPTEFTINNGLLALIGQDRDDVYALSGLVNAKVGRSDAQIVLTLHSKMQEIAQRRLLQGLRSNQVAALVLLEPDTGEILAAASHPIPPAGVHPWDRMAFSQSYPLKDTTQFAPWQGESGFNAPGSTFKVLTTLAALTALKSGDDPRLEQMLSGVRLARLQSVTGLNPDSYEYVIPASRLGDGDDKRIKNFGQISIRSSAKKSDMFGLREALRNSVNIWFIQLVDTMDGQYLPDGTQTHLVKTARQFGFTGYYSLAPESLALSRYPARRGARGDVLNALGGHLDSDSTQTDSMPLLQNSIGQAMYTSPLQMARLAAAVATGYNIQPRLLLHWNRRDLVDDYPRPQALELPHLDWLQAGMKAVVKEGTARTAFSGSPLAERVVGKTGTAQVKTNKKTLGITAWFIGWHANAKGRPTLAFACQVTRARGGGGAVCAPLVRDVLQALDAAKLLENNRAG